MSSGPQGAAAPVLAAGALVWRRGARGGVEVLLVERTQHRDLSLPKGKLDPGESLPECAAREIAEETGCRIALGAPLGTSEYRLPDGRDKVVYYWQAELDDDREHEPFSPNDEIRALHWLGLEAAKRACTYAHDAAVIERFEERLERGHERTFPIIAVRHGKAADPYSWDGDDEARPLTDRGRRQAQSIAGGIAAFGPERILSSAALRCVQTVEPLEERTGIRAKPRVDLSQEAFDSREAVARRVAKAVRKRRGTVLCSHAPVIPDIVSAVVHETDAAETERTHRASMLHTAEFTVLHVSAGEEPSLVALETHCPPAT
ncbi:NUDIX domain-containing protein [Agrococcus sp. HG114]|uniref:NUDIX hydrolase n=1 Tax=Agrococcus sp. HG114 TaxID=2969757 RepID=UPI00215A3EED|nr:NUDIX domain-containing protein [Agrococcus sp. HG114]MCR8670945.1 NUDIX domain-containing protein [Agrococcus sp. HG114]